MGRESRTKSHLRPAAVSSLIETIARRVRLGRFAEADSSRNADAAAQMPCWFAGHCRGWAAAASPKRGREELSDSLTEAPEACEVNDTPAWNHRLHRPGLPSPGYILADE